MVRGGGVALLKKLFARLERFGLQTRVLRGTDPL
jgi:hypothetical protein